MKKLSSLFWYALLLALSATHAYAQSYPTGFSQQTVASTIDRPTAMAFAPDGRLFVCEQRGIIKIVKNGALLSTAFASFTVNSSGERGLLGLAFDPNFSTNRHIYIYYTVASGANNRLSRITANGDVMQAGSEVVLLNFDPLSTATNHNGGFLKFGADGKLYIAIGENANTANSQNLDTYHGKMLRVNTDGSAPTDNPYYGAGNSAQRNRVWAWGLRNPFSFDIQPGSGKIFINDVGGGRWEEINDASVGGRNFGWPTNEGIVNPVPSGFTNPVYAYAHSTGDDQGCAITGGTFFNPSATNYPNTYVGSYFYLDYCNGQINRLNATNQRSAFASGLLNSPVCMATGPDGNLYFLSRTNKALYRIVYNGGAAPVITTHPQSQSKQVGESVTFSAAASGSPTPTFQWRKGSSNIQGATGSTYTINNLTLADAGTYSVIASNTAGSATSDNATLSVTAPNQPPTVQITTPTGSPTYRGGQTINFVGTANDPEDGSVAPTNVEWTVVFHHDDHTHPGPSVNLAADRRSGSFVIPTEGETASNVFYRLYLTAQDNQGNTSTTYRDIRPLTAQITLASNPAGLRLTLDGEPITTPTTVTRVQGVNMTIGVVSPQIRNTDGLTYTFNNWSHGGAASQTFGTPTSNTTYTANFGSSLRNPDNPANTVRGLDYKYYQGNWNAIPVFDNLVPIKSGTHTNFNLSLRNQNDYFGFRFDGFVNIPSDGMYDFYTTSDEGSLLYIGQTLVVNNDGLHTARERTGRIGLKQGLHAIRVEFFEKTGSQSLVVNYAGPTISKRIIPSNALFRSTVGTPVAQITPAPPADAVLVFPNPAGPVVNLSVGELWSKATVKLINAAGRVVREITLSDNETDLDTDDLPDGIYLLSVQKGNRTNTQRVLISK